MSQSAILERVRHPEIFHTTWHAKKLGLEFCDFRSYLDPTRDTAFPLEFAYHLLGDVSGKRVLDLGCGSGENTAILARRGAQVVGLDISPQRMHIARERLRGCGLRAELHVAPACHTRLADESVDVVFCVALLHHLHLELAQQEIRRVLRRGGCLIATEPIAAPDFAETLRKAVPLRAKGPATDRFLTRAELARFAGGFEILTCRNFRLPLVGWIRLLLPFLEPAGWRLDAWLLQTFPCLARFASVQVMKLRKSQ
jgi:SAM-dependent methyltransferase